MLRLAPVFANGMVLCRNRELRVFGSLSHAATLSARLVDAEGRILSQGERNAPAGRFVVRMPPCDAGIDLTLTVSDGTDERVLRDVAVGEVFLAGGQSNMKLKLCEVDEGATLIATHRDPLLRFYRAPYPACADEPSGMTDQDAHWEAALPGACGDMSAAAYFFARRVRETQGVPVGVIGCYVGGTGIACWMDEAALRESEAGRKRLKAYHDIADGLDLDAYNAAYERYLASYPGWCARAEAAAPEQLEWDALQARIGQCPWPPPMGPRSPFRPTGLFSEMLAPLAPYALTAFLYYQGEEDANDPDGYAALMASLIRRWRALFDAPALPFLAVQLPAYRFGDGWVLIREAQAQAAQALPRVGLCILHDTGDPADIHPKRKRVVGERLYREAERLLYGDDEDWTASPHLLRVTQTESELRFTFSHPIRCEGEPRGIVGIDEHGDELPVHATLRAGELIIQQQSGLCGVRYAWRDVPDGTLFGDDGLPLAPFVWKGANP